MSNTFGISLDTVRSFLGLPNGSPTDIATDLRLQLWLEASIQIIENIIGRSLGRAIYRDTFGYRPKTLYLNVKPVSHLISVSYGGLIFNESTDYLFFPTTGRLEFTSLSYWHSRQFWGQSLDHLTVDYVGGYTTLPASFVLAALVAVQAAYRMHLAFLHPGGIVKSIDITDVGATTFETKFLTTSAAMQQALNEHLSDITDVSTTFVLGAPLLHETERIGDAPGSPL